MYMALNSVFWDFYQFTFLLFRWKLNLRVSLVWSVCLEKHITKPEQNPQTAWQMCILIFRYFYNWFYLMKVAVSLPVAYILNINYNMHNSRLTKRPVGLCIVLPCIRVAKIKKNVFVDSDVRKFLATSRTILFSSFLPALHLVTFHIL